MSARPTKRSYVLCLGNRRYKASLIVRRLYQTIEDDEALAHGMIRVIDESGEDYLFPQRQTREDVSQKHARSLHPPPPCANPARKLSELAY